MTPQEEPSKSLRQPSMNKFSGEIGLRYEALFHNTLNGILIFDYEKEIIIDANDIAVSILGYDDKHDLIGMSKFEFIPKSSDYFPGEDLQAYVKDNGRRIKAGESFRTRGIFINREGTHILVKAKVVPTFYKKGEGFTIFQDVTKKVLAHKAQKKTEKRYKTIFDNSLEAIIYIDPKGFTPLICNNNALEILQVADLEELTEHCAHVLRSKAHRHSTLTLIELAAYVNEARDLGRRQFYTWLARKDGELRRMNVVIVSDMSDQDEHVLIVFARDVTNFYEYRQSLVSKNEELEKYIKSNLQLENFAYLASHDLQTPLRSMISFTQLLNHRLKDKTDEKEKELMEHIVNSGKKMRDLITNLLAFSSIDKQEVVISRLNLHDILDNLLFELEPLISATKAKISRSNLPKIVQGDAIKINRLLYHLVLNSLKFRNHNKSPVIHISCKEKSTHWQFDVTDNGIGIEEQYIDKIFGMFKRLHNDELYQGTGIGLTLARKIAGLHGGRLWAESDFGRGSTFYFTLIKDAEALGIE